MSLIYNSFNGTQELNIASIFEGRTAEKNYILGALHYVYIKGFYIHFVFIWLQSSVLIWS